MGAEETDAGTDVGTGPAGGAAMGGVPVDAAAPAPAPVGVVPATGIAPPPTGPADPAGPAAPGPRPRAKKRPVYLASYGSRVGATLIDGAVEGVPALIGFIISNAVASDWHASDEAKTFALAAVILGVSLTFIAGLENRAHWQGRTGQSIGKKACGIAVIMPGTRLPTGPGLGLLRQLAHIVDAWLIVGYLWPLWDPRRRTFADMMTGTVVVKVR